MKQAVLVAVFIMNKKNTPFFIVITSAILVVFTFLGSSGSFQKFLAQVIGPANPIAAISCANGACSYPVKTNITLTNSSQPRSMVIRSEWRFKNTVPENAPWTSFSCPANSPVCDFTFWGGWAGHYVAELVIYNNTGGSSSTSKEFDIGASVPTAAISCAVDSCSFPLRTNITLRNNSTSSSSITRTAWRYRNSNDANWTNWSCPTGSVCDFTIWGGWAGHYLVELTAYNSAGASAPVIKEFDIGASVPTAAISCASANCFYAKGNVTLTNSSQPAGSITRSEWRVRNAAEANVAWTTFSCPANTPVCNYVPWINWASHYIAELTVYNSAGASNTVSKEFDVGAHTPSVAINCVPANCTGVRTINQKIDFINTSTDTGGDIANSVWCFRPGEGENGGCATTYDCKNETGNPICNHFIYVPNTGTATLRYKMRLTVTDRQGNTSSRDSDLIIQSPTPVSGLTGYYNFDGNVNDSSGRNNNGTIFGLTSKPGKIREAYNFNGQVNNYVDLPVSQDFGISSSGVTFSAWVKTLASDGVVIKRGFNSSAFENQEYMLAIKNGFPELTIGNRTNYNQVRGTARVDDNNWHLLTGVITPSSIRLYVDGMRGTYSTDKTISGWLTGAIVQRIGFSKGADYFNGLIDEVKFWNYALPGEQIQTAFQSFNFDVSIATLKDIYSVGESIQITDPPATPETEIKLVDLKQKGTTSSGLISASNSKKTIDGKIIIQLKSGVTINNKVKNSGYSKVETNKPSLNTIFEKYHVAEFKKVMTQTFGSKAKNASAKAVSDELNRFYIINLDFDFKTRTQAAISDLKIDTNIESVEPYYVFKSNFVPNDPQYNSQRVNSFVNTKAESAWDIQQGNGSAVIAIIDSGVDYTHEDLISNMKGDCRGVSGCPAGTGFDFVGFTDNDILLWQDAGFVFYTQEDYRNWDTNPMDVGGHGTACAGVAAAATNNRIGVAGVCPNCKIMPIRAGVVLGYPQINGAVMPGGYLAPDFVFNAIGYSADNGAKVISMSFGLDLSSQEIDSLQFIIDYAHIMGATLVAALPNTPESFTTDYPSGLDHVIGVACTNGNSMCSFSGFGPIADIGAPGQDILTTMSRTAIETFDVSGYGRASGTSLSTPFIAGVAGLILSKNPILNPDQVEEILTAGVDKVIEERYIHSGRVNMLKALVSDTVARPQSKIVNRGESSTGNMTISLKRKSGNSWVEVDSIPATLINFPATSFEKLDYRWNDRNIKVNQPGLYRIYSSIENGRNTTYNYWEFTVQ